MIIDPHLGGFARKGPSAHGLRPNGCCGIDFLLLFRLGRFPLPMRARPLNFNRRGVFLETGANGWCFGPGHLSSRSSRDLTTSIQWVLDYERQGRAGARLVSMSNLYPSRASPFSSKQAARGEQKMDACGCGETLALRSEVRVWPGLGSLEVFPYLRRSTEMGGRQREPATWSLPVFSTPAMLRVHFDDVFRRRWAERGRRTDYVREYQPPKKNKK